ncbi:hypothetical protein ACROYT_G014413 [Oculina patagonica]
MITFDCEQNLPTPNLHHSDVFYAIQLWVYNFGIHDCLANQGDMMMWAENVAKRASSAVVLMPGYIPHRIQKWSKLTFRDEDVAAFREEMGAFLEGHLALLDVLLCILGLKEDQFLKFSPWLNNVVLPVYKRLMMEENGPSSGEESAGEEPMYMRRGC